MSQFTPENGAIVPVNASQSIPNPAAALPPQPSLKIVESKKDKRAGFFTAALWMLRKQRGKKPPPLEVNPIADKQNQNGDGADSGRNWTKVLGLVRPLCLQQSAVNSPPLSPANHKSVEIAPPQKQAAAETSQPVTPATMSQYGSALSLRDLDNCSDDEEEEFSDEVFDAISYDEMIDSKAEEFIAQFYKQVHLEKGVPGSRHHDRGV